MTFVPDNKGGANFARSFTNMVITWNHVEDEARTLLRSFSEGGFGGFVAIQSLGNTSLTSALRAVADIQRPEVKDHLVHFAKCMDLHRAYRNFYVHSLSFIGSSHDGEGAGGVLIAWEVKGTIQRVDDYVKDTVLEHFAGQLEELRLYGTRLNQCLLRELPPKGLAGILAHVQPQPWPDKPSLPQQLAKRRQGLQSLLSQAQSSSP
jgi:hypothetical protein